MRIARIMEHKKFITRPGASLTIVLLLSSLAVFILFNMLLIFKWAVSSNAANQNKINERAFLESLIAQGYHWLKNEINAGRADKYININKNLDILKLDDLIIFSKSAEYGAYVSVYDMSYDIAALTDAEKNNIKNFKWLSSDGAEKFFPSKSGAFLIRAVLPKSANSGKMLEVIVTRDNKKLWLWDETWF